MFFGDLDPSLFQQLLRHRFQMPNDTFASDCWHSCPGGRGPLWPHWACHVGLCQMMHAGSSNLAGWRKRAVSHHWAKASLPGSLGKPTDGERWFARKPRNPWSFLPLWRLRWSTIHGTSVISCCTVIGKLCLECRAGGFSSFLSPLALTTTPGVQEIHKLRKRSLKTFTKEWMSSFLEFLCTGWSGYGNFYF